MRCFDNAAQLHRLKSKNNKNRCVGVESYDVELTCVDRRRWLKMMMMMTDRDGKCNRSKREAEATEDQSHIFHSLHNHYHSPTRLR